jgi:hypothetical protein
MKTEPVEILPPRERVARCRRRGSLKRWLGAPSAAQRRLLDKLLDAMVVDFDKYGSTVIETVRKIDPVNYLRLMTALVQKPLSDLETERLFSNDDVADALARVDQIAVRLSIDFDGMDDRADDPLPGAGLQPLPETE